MTAEKITMRNSHIRVDGQSVFKCILGQVRTTHRSLRKIMKGELECMASMKVDLHTNPPELKTSSCSGDGFLGTEPSKNVEVHTMVKI